MQTAVVKFDSDFCVFREEILRTRYYPKKYRFVDWYVPPSVDWYSSDYYYRQVQCLVYESGVSSLSLVRRHALTGVNVMGVIIYYTLFCYPTRMYGI
jgi:hypothetical protein